ncbi:MAG: hypothetical protein ABJ327_17890 [Litoreibacter sp.]
MTTSLISIPFNRRNVMIRAWELMRENMRWQAFNKITFAQLLRQAWREAQTRFLGLIPPCDLTPAQSAQTLAHIDANSTPRQEIALGDIVDQEAVNLAEKRELIESAKGRFCSVTFIKVDGSERTMKVQPAALKFKVKGDAASDSAKKATINRKVRHPHLMPVWEIDSKVVRSVNLATVTMIVFDGLAHVY